MYVLTFKVLDLSGVVGSWVLGMGKILMLIAWVLAASLSIPIAAADVADVADV